MKKHLKQFLIYIFIVFAGYGVGRYYSPNTAVKQITANDRINDEFSEEALLAYMKKLKIKYPETVLSQSRLETGNFQSDIFKENHNLFGMKLAELRPTSAIGVNRGHAQYRNWKESVIDYALLQSYIIAKLPSVNNEEYRTYIQKFYSTTADYLKRIDRTLGPGEVLSAVRTGKDMTNLYAEVGTKSEMNNSLNILTSFKALYALPDLSRMNEVSHDF
jgi:hypothetical protein